MPSFNALAGAALTPGGVQSGINDLVSALVNAPNQRRQIEMQQAAQLAQQQSAADQFGLEQDKFGYAKQHGADELALAQTAEKRHALTDAGDIAAKFAAAGSRGAGNGFTMEDAIGKTPAAKNIPNPDASAVGPDGQPDLLKQLMAHPTIRQNLTPEERVAEARRLQQAANGVGAGGFLPIDQTGHVPVDPQAMAVVRALQAMGGLSVGPGVPGAGPGQEPGGAAPSKDISPTGGTQPGSPAGAPGQPAAPQGKVATRQEVQQMAAQAGYTEQEAVEYYKSLGYTIQ